MYFMYATDPKFFKLGMSKLTPSPPWHILKKDKEAIE